MKYATDVTDDASDLDLMRSAAAGDVSAFHRLVDRHARKLFRTALALSSTRADAEDILQETLFGAFRNLKTFGGRSSVKTWLTGILMRQAAKGWNRSRNSRNTRSVNASPEGGEFDDAALCVKSATENSDQRMDFAAMLGELPPVFREVLVLREIQQMSYDEIAQALGIPSGTVESRVHRARLRLRERLSAYATVNEGPNHDL